MTDKFGACDRNGDHEPTCQTWGPTVADLAATVADLQQQVDFWQKDRQELQQKDDALIAEQAKEIADLYEMNMAQARTISASQAYAAQLREIVQHVFDKAWLTDEQYDMLQKALAIKPDETALREHEEKLKERIASMVEGMGLVGNEGYHCADKIRKLEF